MLKSTISSLYYFRQILPNVFYQNIFSIKHQTKFLKVVVEVRADWVRTSTLLIKRYWALQPLGGRAPSFSIPSDMSRLNAEHLLLLLSVMAAAPTTASVS